MKSLCVKSNNEKILSFFSHQLSSLNQSSIIISKRNFKIHSNLIVHYIGTDIDFFINAFASSLANTIIYFYQHKLLKKSLEYNYFYFSKLEREKILEISENFLNSDDITKQENHFLIFTAIIDYIKENKSMILDGFVNFRLPNYIKNLDYVIDIGVNKFLIDKEYNEFIDILKLYISFTPSKSSIIHLIYNDGESILLDQDKNIIPINDKAFDAKYLSDISFSSNDYALNTLLALTPQKLVVHLMDDNSDEFINTLKLIFENRLEITNKLTSHHQN